LFEEVDLLVPRVDLIRETTRKQNDMGWGNSRVEIVCSRIESNGITEMENKASLLSVATSFINHISS
jgi:hypothetical protein